MSTGVNYNESTMNKLIIIAIIAVVVIIVFSIPDLRDRVAPFLVGALIIAAIWFLRAYLIFLVPALIILVVAGVYLIDRAQKKKLAQEKQQKEAAYLDEVKEMNLDEQAEQTLINGYAFVSSFRKYNERIPDAEMTEKITKLEDTTTQIFDEVKKHPNKARKLNKLMEFYLPMTDKILAQYADFDEAKTTGENVEESKKTIRESLDSINEAFANMLNNLYLDNNIDISSDAAVLKQMFESDGLLGKE